MELLANGYLGVQVHEICSSCHAHLNIPIEGGGDASTGIGLFGGAKRQRPQSEQATVLNARDDRLPAKFVGDWCFAEHTADHLAVYRRGRCANPDNVDAQLTINPDSFDVHEMHCEVLVARANKRGDYLAKFRCDDNLQLQSITKMQIGGIGLARASYWSFKHRPIADKEIRLGCWSLSEECVLWQSR
jgi:hypothetical protein